SQHLAGYVGEATRPVRMDERPLLKIAIQPRGNPAHRGWHTVMLDFLRSNRRVRNIDQRRLGKPPSVCLQKKVLTPDDYIRWRNIQPHELSGHMAILKRRCEPPKKSRVGVIGARNLVDPR